MSKTILNENQEAVGRFQTICKKCDCHFSFSEIDTYKHTNYDRDGASIDTYIDCPKCQNSIAAEPILKPNRNYGMFGISFDNIQQKVFNNVNVQALRSTVSDGEFRRLLIKYLS